MTNRRGRPSSLPLRGVVAACTVLVGTVACVQPSANSNSGSPVVFVGDSLAAEAAQFLPALIEPRTFVPQIYFGTAPCDWIGGDLEITADSVVVISFIGNSGTPCMADGAGGFLQGDALVDRYRTDVGALIEIARGTGARVLLVGQPARADSVSNNDIVERLNEVYTELASTSGVMFVDAGAALENPDGTFAIGLPCVPNEAECGPSGSNVVRSDDGVHFCPGTPPAGPCPVYSSGAYRFAKAIADAILSS